MVFYRIGSVDEQPGEEGLAHYLEHMMFMGTTTYPRGEFHRFIMRGGGGHNATTTHDGTTYFQRMPKSGLGHLMALEADRMQNLQFAESAAITERNVVMEEFRGNAGAPGFPFYLAMSEALYPNHPYSIPPIGNEAQISRFDGAKAMAFYQRHYMPQRAIVVIGGDVTEDEVRSLAANTYALIKRGQTAPDEPPLPKLLTGSQRVVVAHPRMSSVMVRRTYLTGGARMMSPQDATALNLFAYIVGDGMLSRLHRSLVTEGLASSVSGGIQIRRYAGELSFSAMALPGVRADQIEEAFDRVIAEVARDGVAHSRIRGHEAALPVDEGLRQGQQFVPQRRDRRADDGRLATRRRARIQAADRAADA